MSACSPSLLSGSMFPCVDFSGDWQTWVNYIRPQQAWPQDWTLLPPLTLLLYLRKTEIDGARKTTLPLPLSASPMWARTTVYMGKPPGQLYCLFSTILSRDTGTSSQKHGTHTPATHTLPPFPLHHPLVYMCRYPKDFPLEESPLEHMHREEHSVLSTQSL